MGPIALFDKSFLQSLSVDESVWFDLFFIANVCPLFYAETLADLEKAVREGRTPEDEVGIIADKFPEMHGAPSPHHTQLCAADLLGQRVPMTGQIPLAGGREVMAGEKKGVVFEQSPEAKAFARWTRREFLEIERSFARTWREDLASVDLAAGSRYFKALGLDHHECKTLEQAKAVAESVVLENDKPYDRMHLALTLLNIHWSLHEQIKERWRAPVCPALATYAPYASHVLTVEVFSQLALRARLISTERASNRVDVAYLFYLPFCMLFVSSDRLHQNCARHFLREDQEFVWGLDLKEDLRKLNRHFAQLPDSVKGQGVLSFAAGPPKEGDFLVTRLWDRFLPTWRDRDRTESDRYSDTQLLEDLRSLSKAPPLPPGHAPLNSQEVDMIQIERRVRRRKGSWYQVPKDIKTDHSDFAG
jgi:hypothetical protein